MRAQERTIKGAKNAKNAASEIRQKADKGKQTIKTAKRSVKYAKSTAKATKQTIKTAKKTAKTSAKAAKITEKAARAAAKVAAQATRLAVKAAIKAIILMVKAAIAAIKGLIAAIAAGGWVAVLILLLIGAIAVILLSPFGIFSGGGADGTPSITEVVQTINGELNEKISSMQAGKNVSQVEVVYEGSDDGTPINNWPDVLAVFAVKTNMDMENPQDVVVMDHEKVELLRSVFWDIYASFRPANSLRALKKPAYDPVKIWLLFFQHIPDSLGRTPELLLKSMIEVGHAVVPNGSRYLLHRHIALL